METAFNQLANLPENKQQVATFSDKLRNELTSGLINPLELLRMQKMIEKVFENIKPDLIDLAIDEAMKYEKGFEFKGCKMEISEAGVSYDYSNCGSSDWNECNRVIVAYTEKRKEIEKLLKAITTPISKINEDGEIETINPPIKKSTTTIKVKI
jgi:hypothetical protein